MTSPDSPTAAPPPRRKFGVEAMIYAGSRVIMRSATFLTGVVIARALGPTGRGMVASLSVPAALAGSLSELGVRQAAAYHVGRGTFPLKAVVGTLLAMLPLSGLLSAFFALAYFEIAHVAEGDWITRLLAVAAVPSTIGVAYVSGILLGRQSITLFSRASWLPAVTALAMVSCACLYLGYGVRGALFATALGNFAGFCYALYALRKVAPLHFRFNREIAGKIQKLGFSYAVATFVLLLNYKIMILMLSRFSSLGDVGLYTQAAAIAEMLWEVPHMVSGLLFARAVNATSREEMARKILTFARLAIVVAALAACALALVAPWLFPFVYGPEFAASASICVILLPGVVAFIFFRILQTDIHSRGKAWVSLVVIAPTLLCNIGLGYILISRYGAVGAASASSLCYIGATIAYIAVYSRITGVPLKTIFGYSRKDIDLVLRSLPLKLKRKDR